MDKSQIVYKLTTDDRLYDVEKGCFVETADTDKTVIPLYKGGKPAGEDYLRETLEFYGWPVGAELMTLDEAKNAKIDELNAGLETARRDSKANILSSVGFAINANTTANENIAGLIALLEATEKDSTSFMAFDNTLQTVTLEELKTMQLELVAWGQALYAYKWQVRAQIDAAEDVETVMAIEIDYSNASVFYNAG